MAYDLPTTDQNITSLYGAFGYVQDVSSGWFFLMILFAIFIIVFISMKNYTSSRAFAGASFLNMILAIILRTLGFISNKWMYLSIILVGGSAIWLHIDNSKI